MHRFFVAALLGGLLGFLFDALIILMHASFPDLPRPSCYRSGSGALVELQDLLMDRELAIFMCMKLAADGFDFFFRGACAGVIALSAYDRIGDCWLRKWLLRLLAKFVKSRLVAPATVSLGIFSFAIYLMNTRCLFLCAACFLNPYNLISFLLSGIFPLLLCMLLTRMRRRSLNLIELFAHLMLIAFCSVLLYEFWPDLINPVAENTGSIMRYNKGCWGLVACGTNNPAWWIFALSDSVIVCFMAYVALEASRCVLAKHVFEPLLSGLVAQRPFYGLAKVVILLVVTLDLNFVVAEAWSQEVAQYRLVIASRTSPEPNRLIRLRRKDMCPYSQY